MEERLKYNLRKIQSNPTTGIAHNQQLITTQVESIFMLDSLKEEINHLNKALENSDKINQKLEQSNYRLQWAMLLLTAITTFVTIYPILKEYMTSLFTTNIFGFSLTAATTGLIAAVLAGFIVGALLAIVKNKMNKIIITNIGDQIKLRDSVKIVLKDEDGNIKETREVESDR